MTNIRWKSSNTHRNSRNTWNERQRGKHAKRCLPNYYVLDIAVSLCMFEPWRCSSVVWEPSVHASKVWFCGHRDMCKPSIHSSRKPTLQQPFFLISEWVCAGEIWMNSAVKCYSKCFFMKNTEEKLNTLGSFDIPRLVVFPTWIPRSCSRSSCVRRIWPSDKSKLTSS